MTDRRAILALHVADWWICSATNPGGYLFDKAIDVTSEAGRQDLRSRFAARAQDHIACMKLAAAQGGICWDMDGARYGTYLGCPDLATMLNPEITGIASEYFTAIRAAGFKTGCCIRPVKHDPAVLDANLPTVPRAEVFDRLLSKVKWAHRNWGCTLFYVDSNVARPNDLPDVKNSWSWQSTLIPASIFTRLHRAMPDCRFFPELENDDYYGAGLTPYLEGFSGELGPPSFIMQAFPKAYGLVNVNGMDMVAQRDELIACVQRGNILLCNTAEAICTAIGDDIYNGAY